MDALDGGVEALLAWADAGCAEEIGREQHPRQLGHA
jgi:hypothetical protein